MAYETNGSNGHTTSARDLSNGHAPRRSLELKRGGFIASYPPFESLQPSGIDAAWKKPSFGLYVHLPYCRKRCTFCFYKVYTNRNAKPMDRYVEAVLREIDSYGKRGELLDRVVDSIYFGGGTPTTLSEEELRALADRLRANFNISPDVEWTSESEPGTLTEDKVATLREIGVNRLSMGVQTMDDDLLHKNGRSHSSDGVYRALEWARKSQFPIINLDLMSGILDETLETWDASLQKFIELGIEHISIYRMEVYKNTLLYAAGYTGPGVGGIPTNEEELEMWLRGVDKLEGAGYIQTSGHSFVKRVEDDHVQRRALWSHAGELLGMGVSSYSYMNDTVFQNTSDWGTYVGKVTNGESPVGRGLHLNSRQKMARELILGLKHLRLDRATFRHRHGLDVLDLWAPQVTALVNDGLLEVTEGAISLTRKARPYVDVVCSVFYLPEHSEWKFHRFATQDELAQAAVLDFDQPTPLHGSFGEKFPLPDELLLAR